jgi:hypothetical protein
LGAVLALLALVFVLATLLIEALPAARLNGLHFFTAPEWNPGNTYGGGSARPSDRLGTPQNRAEVCIAGNRHRHSGGAGDRRDGADAPHYCSSFYCCP